MRLAHVLIIGSALASLSGAGNAGRDVGAGHLIMEECADYWSMNDVNEIADKTRQAASFVTDEKARYRDEFDKAVNDAIEARKRGDEIGKEIDRLLLETLIDVGKGGLEVGWADLANPHALLEKAATGAKGLTLKTLQSRQKLADADAQKAQAKAYIALANYEEIRLIANRLDVCVQDQLSYIKGLELKNAGNLRISGVKSRAAPTPPPNSGAFGLQMENMSPEDSAQEKAAVAGAVNARGQH